MTDSEDCLRAVEVVGDGLTTTDYRRLDQAPQTNEAREAAARGYLEAACHDVRSYAIRNSRYRNHACAIPGKVEDRIVIGAHYDKTDKGAGIADNWTGVVITARLLDYFTERRPHHTLEFVMFGEEEPGMRGSTSYIRGRDLDGIIAMINVDTLGVDVVTVDKRSDNDLECLAHSVANATGIGVRALNVRQTTGDWEPFKARGVPVLNLHALDRRSALTQVHSRRDRREAVDDALFDDAWRLVLNVVVNLDGTGRGT